MARRFVSASSQYLSAPHAADLAWGGPFYFRCRLRLNAKTAAASSIASKLNAAATAGEYQLVYVQSGDRIQISASQGGAPWLASVVANAFGSPPVGQWLSVVFWADTVNGFLGLGINGLEDYQGSVYFFTSNSALPFNLAAYGNAGQFLQGDLAEVAIYRPTTAYSTADRQELYKPHSPLLFRPEDLVAYWPLLDGLSSPLELIQGPALNLSAINAPAAIDHPPVLYPRKSRASGVPPTYARATQLALEVLRTPVVYARATQLALEVLRAPAG